MGRFVGRFMVLDEWPLVVLAALYMSRIRRGSVSGGSCQVTGRQVSGGGQICGQVCEQVRGPFG